MWPKSERKNSERVRENLSERLIYKNLIRKKTIFWGVLLVEVQWCGNI